MALTLLKAGKLPEEFIEGMMCEGGCVGGPSKHIQENIVMRTRTQMMQKADDRSILENVKNYPMDQFSMFREK